MGTQHLDDIGEQIQALLLQENSSSYRKTDYLGLNSALRNTEQRSGCASPTSFTPFPATDNNLGQLPSWQMSTRARWQIGQWFHKTISDFNFPSQFAMIAMDYFDRFMTSCNQLPSTKEDVQLIALTCFYLAVKLFQAGPVLSTQQMSFLSGGLYTARQVADTEKQILFQLKWSLHPPCAVDFLRPYFLILARQGCLPSNLAYDNLFEMALKFLNASVLDYFFVAHKLLPSQLAAAAILNAIQFMSMGSTNLSVQDFVGIMRKCGDCYICEAAAQVCRQRLWKDMDGPGCAGNVFATAFDACGSPQASFGQHHGAVKTVVSPQSMPVAPSRSPNSIFVLNTSSEKHIETIPLPSSLHFARIIQGTGPW